MYLYLLEIYINLIKKYIDEIVEKFNKEKLYGSLKRAGAQSGLAEEICKEMAKAVHPGVSTEEILNQTLRCLKKENPIYQFNNKWNIA